LRTTGPNQSSVTPLLSKAFEGQHKQLAQFHVMSRREGFEFAPEF
jgi:hypothetical protein